LRQASEHHLLRPLTSEPHPGHARGSGYSTTASSSSSAGIGVSESRLLSLPIRTTPLGTTWRGSSTPNPAWVTVVRLSEALQIHVSELAALAETIGGSDD